MENTLYKSCCKNWVIYFNKNQDCIQVEKIEHKTTKELVSEIMDSQLYLNDNRDVSIKEKIYKVNETYDLNDSKPYHNTYEPAYYDDIYHKMYTGMFKYYHKEGQVKCIETFDLGILNGPQIVFYKNTFKLSEGFYKNGMKDGLWTYYLDEGTVHSSGFYNEGERVGVWHFMNGQTINYETDDRFNSLTIFEPEFDEHTSDRCRSCFST